MVSYNSVQPKIDKGRGKAAGALGEPCSVYRLSDTSTGNYLDEPNCIATGQPIFFRGVAAKDIRASLESDSKLGTYWFEIIADMSNYQLGDIFLVTDPIYGAGSTFVPGTSEFRAICLAQHAPIKKSFGARLNTTIQVFRMPCGNNPASSNSNYFPSGQNDGTPLALVNGQFQEAPGADPTNIPAGLMSTGRTYGEKTFNDLPSDQRKSAWYCYVPPLPGFDFREGDQIVAANGASYRVLIPYEQQVGAVGSQLYLERESAGPGC